MKSRKDPVWQQICDVSGRSNPVSVCIDFSSDRLGQQTFYRKTKGLIEKILDPVNSQILERIDTEMADVSDINLESSPKKRSHSADMRDIDFEPLKKWKKSD